jgi:hypothetical protein
MLGFRTFGLVIRKTKADILLPTQLLTFDRPVILSLRGAKGVFMNLTKNVSLLSVGAFVAFASIYFDVVSDAGKGAYYALGLLALVWIVELSGRRRNAVNDSEPTRKPKR